MEDADIKILMDTSDRLIGKVTLDWHRYLYDKIVWGDRLICIKGPRGVGKTTLILQHIRETFGLQSEKAIYLTCDHIWFASHDALELIEWLNAHGYTYVFLDEVHHLPNWQSLIKTIADCYPDLNVVYSGSSILKLTDAQGDLSRRQAVYNLKGLSFREYLSFEGALKDAPVLTLEDIVTSHRAKAGAVVDRLKVLPEFARYRVSGYYPFYRSVQAQFSERLLETVNKVLEVDLPSVEEVSQTTIRKAKKMLMIIAAGCPQQTNMKDLYRELETDRNLGLRLLVALERAELVLELAAARPKLKSMSRTEKLYLGDTNLMYALTGAPEPGNVRETFFMNQLKAAGHAVTYVGKGDFVVDDRYLFEAGGKGKGFKQIAGMESSFVAADDIELGLGNKIPLWLFGFLY